MNVQAVNRFLRLRWRADTLLIGFVACIIVAGKNPAPPFTKRGACQAHTAFSCVIPRWVIAAP
jgi:hypothetical protein